MSNTILCSLVYKTYIYTPPIDIDVFVNTFYIPDVATKECAMSSLETELATMRVTRGARALDRLHPDWEKEIDLSTLDEECAESCILGQLYGEFEKAPEELNAKHRVVYLGFFKTKKMDFEELTRAWKKLIYKRRVNCGVAKLNSIFPGWKGEIDTNARVWRRGMHPILRQLYGKLEKIPDTLKDQGSAVQLGLCLGTEIANKAILREAWKEVIEELRRVEKHPLAA